MTSSDFMFNELNFHISRSSSSRFNLCGIGKKVFQSKYADAEDLLQQGIWKLPMKNGNSSWSAEQLVASLFICCDFLFKKVPRDDRFGSKRRRSWKAQLVNTHGSGTHIIIISFFRQTDPLRHYSKIVKTKDYILTTQNVGSLNWIISIGCLT